MGQLSGDVWASPPGGTSAAACPGVPVFSWPPPLVFLALRFLGEDDFRFSFNLKRRLAFEYMLIKYGVTFYSSHTNTSSLANFLSSRNYASDTCEEYHVWGSFD